MPPPNAFDVDNEADAAVRRRTSAAEALAAIAGLGAGAGGAADLDGCEDLSDKVGDSETQRKSLATSVSESLSRISEATLLSDDAVEELEKKDPGVLVFLRSTIGFVMQCSLLFIFVAIDCVKCIAGRMTGKDNGASTIVTQSLATMASLATLTIGIVLSMIILGPVKGIKECFTPRHILLFAPAALLFGLAQSVQLVAYAFWSAGTVKVVGQGRLIVAAILSVILLRKSYKLIHWIVLALITFTALVFNDVQGRQKSYISLVRERDSIIKEVADAQDAGQVVAKFKHYETDPVKREMLRKAAARVKRDDLDKVIIHRVEENRLEFTNPEARPALVLTGNASKDAEMVFANREKGGVTVKDAELRLKESTAPENDAPRETGGKSAKEATVNDTETEAAEQGAEPVMSFVARRRLAELDDDIAAMDSASLASLVYPSNFVGAVKAMPEAFSDAWNGPTGIYAGMADLEDYENYHANKDFHGEVRIARAEEEGLVFDSEKAQFAPIVEMRRRLTEEEKKEEFWERDVKDHDEVEAKDPNQVEEQPDQQKEVKDQDQEVEAKGPNQVEEQPDQQKEEKEVEATDPNQVEEQPDQQKEEKEVEAKDQDQEVEAKDPKQVNEEDVEAVPEFENLELDLPIPPAAKRYNLNEQMYKDLPYRQMVKLGSSKKHKSAASNLLGALFTFAWMLSTVLGSVYSEMKLKNSEQKERSIAAQKSNCDVTTLPLMFLLSFGIPYLRLALGDRDGVSQIWWTFYNADVNSPLHERWQIEVTGGQWVGAGFFRNWNLVVGVALIFQVAQQWLATIVVKRMSTVVKSIGQSVSLVLVFFLADCWYDRKPGAPMPYLMTLSFTAVVVALGTLAFAMGPKPATRAVKQKKRSGGGEAGQPLVPAV